MPSAAGSVAGDRDEERTPAAAHASRNNQQLRRERQQMGLALNLIVQTIVWFGFMGAIIFGAAGTIDCTGGWLYLGEMIALSVVFGAYTVRVDPGLLRERLKP